MQQLDAFKTLKNPAHRRTSRRLVDLIGNGLLLLSQLGAYSVLSQTIDQQTQHHNEAQCYQPFGFFHKNRRGQEQGVFQETKTTFDAPLFFVGSDEIGIAEALPTGCATR